MSSNLNNLLDSNGSKLPEEIKGLDTFCLWTYKENSQDPDNPGKHPFDWTNSYFGNDNPALHINFTEALQKLAELPKTGLAIYQPKTGIKMSAEGKDGYLFIVDLDGFLCNGIILDLGLEIIYAMGNSYYEISPSGVGLKIYIVSDLSPFGKRKFNLAPNEFSKTHPNIKKYSSSHAVEIFSSKFWNTVSGNRWPSATSDLKFIAKDELQKILDMLSAVSTNKSQLPKTHTPKVTQNNTERYNKLTQVSLEFVLSKIDHFDEEKWGGGEDGGGVVNILARVYGEQGRGTFIAWSRGDYCGRDYPNFSEVECDDRFDRALQELTKRANGFGIKQLCKLADIATSEVIFEKNHESIEGNNTLSWICPDGASSITQKTELNFPLIVKNKPAQVTENLKALIDYLEITIRYNQITKNSEILLPNFKCVLDEADNTAITLLTDEAIKAGMSSTRILEMSSAIASQNPYCPVRAYIDSKPWDQNSRFNQFLSQINTTDIDIATFLIRKWLIQAVAAAYGETGLNGAGTIVFSGLQGTGKTRLFKDLTSGIPDTFLEGATLDPANKDSVMTTCSHWIVELGELDATFKKSDIAQLKAFLTKNTDTLRKPYAKKDSVFQRRTVFAGTVNDLEFLHDPTGNRRFWPIHVNAIVRNEHIDYQQLWAEVKTWYTSGETWYLDTSEIKLLNQYSEKFTIQDPIIEALHSTYDFYGCTQWHPVEMRTICNNIGLEKPTKGEFMRLAAAIRKANGGQTPKQSNNKKYHYVPKNLVPLIGPL